jgi:hypothetical protein
MPEYTTRLPHFHPEDAYLFLTWRLWGSLPAKLETHHYSTPGKHSLPPTASWTGTVQGLGFYGAPGGRSEPYCGLRRGEPGFSWTRFSRIALAVVQRRMAD